MKSIPGLLQRLQIWAPGLILYIGLTTTTFVEISIFSQVKKRLKTIFNYQEHSYDEL